MNKKELKKQLKKFVKTIKFDEEKIKKPIEVELFYTGGRDILWVEN